MGKVDEYRRVLRSTPEWQTYLMEQSGLPGPRGNLELAYAAVEEGNERIFSELLAYDSIEVLENTPQVFLVFCGIAGLGKLLAQGHLDWLERLKGYANDPRWRIREAVAIALQIYTPYNPTQLVEWMRIWAQGSLLEQRAAVAALCEPAFLKDVEICRDVFEILNAITINITREINRKSDAFRILRQTLGYGWSIVVAASPDAGKSVIEPWFETEDQDIRWIMKENLNKKRLQRLDPDWTAVCLDRIKNAADRQ